MDERLIEMHQELEDSTGPIDLKDEAQWQAWFKVAKHSPLFNLMKQET